MSGAIDRRVDDNAQGGGGGSPADMSVEARARRMGWYPKAEFRGRPEDWMDAEQFVERAENELPILRQQMRSLDTKLAGSEAQNRALQGQVQQMNQRLEEAVTAIDSMRDLSTKAEQRGFERAMKRLKEEAKDAAASGDAARVAEVLEETQELIEARIKPPAAGGQPPQRGGQPQPQGGAQPPPQPKGDPVIVAWRDDPNREWFRSSPKMNLYAQAVYEELIDTRRDLSTAELLAETEREVMKKFPTSHYFLGRSRPTDPPPSPPVNQPSGGDHGSGSRNKTGFDALPKEAREEYERINRGNELRKGRPGYKPYTKEEFVRQYTGD